MSNFERAKALFLQGLELFSAGEFAKAEINFRKANELTPDRVSVLGNLAATLLRQDKIAEAKDWARQALSQDATSFEALIALGCCLEREGSLDEALVRFDQAIALRPKAAEAWSNRGNVLKALKRPLEALSHYDKAIALQPDHAEAWSNRGTALGDLDRLEEALASYDKALSLRPHIAETWYNRGNLMSHLKRRAEALDCYAEATRINPEHADAHFNESLCRLNHCDFAAGWEKYEWRWKTSSFVSAPLPSGIPAWHGEKTDGRLLVWAEQGVGDEIFYGSMLAQLQQLAGELMVMVDKRLVPLFRRSFPGVRFRAKDQLVAPELGDKQVAMGSLGRYLRRNLQDFPVASAYLRSDPVRMQHLREMICRPGKRPCGISWESKAPRPGAAKSIRLLDLAPLLGLPALSFVDLQYGDTSAERVNLKAATGIEVQHVDEIDNFNDLDGLASLIDACDFVVTTSNVTAHLAGALGKTSFVLIPCARGKLWYWHEGYRHSPWYPSMTLFRQVADGCWTSAIAKAAGELAALSAG